MNLEGFTMSTAESEYKRVVRHEAGHTLGFPHEHMRKALVARIDPVKAYAYAAANFGWSKEMVDQQILTAEDVEKYVHDYRERLDTAQSVEEKKPVATRNGP